ncbi:MAG: RNA signal recognition particle [Phycisphaerae bacterium]|nr:MAG: RNA signal recognition particle [Phycisphaerae bacterium]
MPKYIDGFVVPIEKKNLAAYRKLAKLAGKVWREHGALQYVEAVGADLNLPYGFPFPKLAKLKKTETVFFSFIVYKSKADRDRVNGKVMRDPRLAKCMDPKAMPFDMKRMSCGGFEVLVEAK